VLAAAAGALGTAEATGVTNVRAAVIRLLTPEGTLVVETDDPAVKVTVEGDGDLVITGAGPQEVRLRAGSYRLRATKDGKPVALERDLVTITRGDRQIVRVRLEGESPAAAVPKAERGAFVVLGGKGVAERKFDTLAEAVLSSSDGDTIEVRGNGPFVTEPVSFGTKRLTIRAATGYRPVIKGAAGRVGEDGWFLLRSQGPLVLEGLELQMTGPLGEGIVHSVLSPLHVANCRFVHNRSVSLWSSDTPVHTVRNCEFVSGPNIYATHIYSYPSNHGKMILENNVLSSPAGHALGLELRRPDLNDVAIHLKDNTVATRNSVIVMGLSVVPIAAEAGAVPDRQPVRWHVTANLFDSINPTRSPMPCKLSLLLPPDWYREGDMPLSAKEAEELLPRLMAWREERNLYGKGVSFQFMRRSKGPFGPKRTEVDELLPAFRTLADWQRMWKAGDSGSLQGELRYEGGDVFDKMEVSPERITADDFRLRPDSPGYRAGKGGKDLGADVDLVGPGPAYERWKKTPEYQQWLKDTGQLRAEAPKPEPGAFVRLGSQGVAERKFDTLAEAVRSASDGDTIEVRGNGPFVTQGVSLGRKSLTIRAAAGFRPVIKGDAVQESEILSYLQSRGPLVLEGLELHMTGPPGSAIVSSLPGPLHVANCRFVLYGSYSLDLQTCNCTVRNCQFVGTSTGIHHVSVDLPNDGQLRLENNVFANPLGHALNLRWADRDLHDSAVHLKHNTVVSPGVAIIQQVVVVPGSAEPGAAPARQPVQMNVSENLFDPNAHPGGMFCLLVPPVAYREDAKPLSVKGAERLLPRLMAWREDRNLYCKGLVFQSFRREDPGGPGREAINEPLPAYRTLADWQRMWKAGDGGSVEGAIRYEGGDMLAKLKATPERITPDDFRLRPDSAGYRAGKGGKDLGADVGLVGPGPAYERWKKTPEYQQWLKDSGQLKK
jgi:hypothetical protein